MFEPNEMLISRITRALVLSILLLVIGMHAQQPNVVAAQPKSVAKFATGFNDQFSVFNTNWAVTSGSWSISTGFLRGVATANKSFSQAYFAQAQYENQDFQVRMRRTGCGTCTNGIFVRSTNDGTIRFKYTNSGEYAIEKCGAASCVFIEPFKPHFAILKGGYNTMRIVAVGNRYDFLINNKLVATHVITGRSYGYAGVSFHNNLITGNTFDVDWAVMKNRSRVCGTARVCVLQNGSR